MFLFTSLFAIIGINFFSGKLFNCVVPGGFINVEVFEKKDCMERGGLWLLNYYNFDRFDSAIMLLFENMTKEGWVYAMNLVSDTTYTRYMPIYNANT